MNEKELTREISLYLLAILLSVVIVTLVMNLWSADLRVPFTYRGDALYFSALVKGIIDNGWYQHNNLIGAPWGLDLHDFPNPGKLPFLIIKAITAFVKDFALAFNIYYLLTFPLTMVTTLFALRQLRISYAPSLIFSLLFTFSSYHFLRGESHILQSSYYLLPLTLLLTIKIYTGEFTLLRRDEKTGKNKLDLFSPPAAAGMLLCLISSGQTIYYTFFSCCFLLIAGLLSPAKKKKNQIATAIILISAFGIGLSINMAPALYHRYTLGSNPEALVRHPSEAELYGLHIHQLLLPTMSHRVNFMANMTNRYLIGRPYSEAMFCSLGVIGTVGFLILILCVFLKFSNSSLRVHDEYTPTIDILNGLNLFAILLAAAGGFGPVLAEFLPQIRAYNRISIYIAFFSITTVAIVLDSARKKHLTTRGTRVLYCGFLVLVLVLGVLDQTTVQFIPSPHTKKEYYSDRDFVSRIESALPEGTMIYQMPYVSFPENPPVHTMTDYDHARAYLHSSKLRWSYGVMKGREGDRWQKIISSMPLPEMTETVVLAGYNGIYVDTHGYEDNGVYVISRISNITGTRPIVSPNGRLYFFDLTEYIKKLKFTYHPEEWGKKRDRALNPVIASWGGGFSYPEGNPENNWRWCSNQGELRINATKTLNRTVTVEMTIKSGYSDNSNLIIRGTTFTDHLTINSTGTYYLKNITLSSDSTTIKFSSDAKRVNAPLDSRYLTFRIVNFQLKE